MKQRMMRGLALLLALSMLLSLTAFAAQENTGTRHVLCTALSAQAEAYYSDGYTYDELSKLAGGSGSLSTVDSALFRALHELMDETMTNSVTYKSLTSYWPDTDCTGGSNDAVLFYSDYVSGGYNREHVWPKSRGSFYQSYGGSDLHHLRPTDTTINSTRNNYTFGNVREHCSSWSTATNGGKTVLWYNAGYSANDCVGLVEVSDNIKGDVARILLYVYVRWEEPNLFEKDPDPYVGPGDDKNDGNKVIESLETLLQWCEEDPVDTWEMGRNDAVQAIQGNRNVFIDYPELAWLLFDQQIPAEMDTPSGNAGEASSAYTLTAVSGDPACGTVSVSGNVVTASPAAGCSVSGYTLSPADAAIVNARGNAFTVTDMTADCTLTVHFVRQQTARVNYHTPKGVGYTGTTAAWLNSTIRLASVSGTPIDNSGRVYSFVGWSLSPFTATTTVPHAYAPGGSYMLTQAETDFYAVFSYTEDDTTHYFTELSDGAEEPPQVHDCPCDAFTDLDSTKWYHESVDYVLSNGLMAGMSRTEFAPNGTVTRAMLVTILYRAAGAPDVSGLENPFSDIPAGTWYTDAIIWAANNAVVAGVGGGRYAPNQAITREQIAAILYRYSGSPAVQGGADGFVDADTVSAYARTAMIWAVSEGIIAGDIQQGRICLAPRDNATRAQLAAMLTRYLT